MALDPLRQLMGHASITETRRYIHFMPRSVVAKYRMPATASGPQIQKHLNRRIVEGKVLKLCCPAPPVAEPTDLEVKFIHSLERR